MKEIRYSATQRYREGWKKVPTDHDMWSELVDEKGVKRASIFYKAAFYDRSAFMRPAADPRDAARRSRFQSRAERDAHV